MLRKCGLYLLSFAVLSTSLSVFFSDVSNAASIYDEVYKTTDTVSSHGRGCSTPIDLTMNWYTTILESIYPSETYKTSLENAIEGDGRWGVTYMNGGSYSEVTVYWTEDNSLYLDWDTSAGSIVYARGVNIKTATLYVADYISCTTPYVGISESDTAVSDASGQWKNLFINVDEENLNIPAGYEGVLPRISLNDNRKVIKPDFKYTVQDKAISATDYNLKLPDFTPDDGYVFSGYTVEWSLFSCDINEATPSTCNNPSLKDHQILPQSSAYSYSVDQYHWYQIEAQYLVEQCYRYPSYPDTPDYCFYVDLNTEFEDYRFLPTSVNLNVDGGTIIGDTKLNDCDESGFCQPKKQKELYDYFADREDFGLTAVLISPLLFYQQLPSMAETCNPISFPLFGQTISLECLKPRYQAWSPLVLGIWTAVINAVVLYAVALGLFRTINQVNDPQDDRIEVQKL